MKDNFMEMTIKELCELSHEQQVEIELRIEPNEYGRENAVISVRPWEKYEPFCPHGTPIVYVKEKPEGR